MRKILIAMAAAFCLFGTSPTFAGSYSADGTYQGSPSGVVTALFAAYPTGGDGLVAGLRTLLLGDPALADDIAYLGARSGGSQQQAAADAMAQALIVLTARGNAFGAGKIATAAQYSGNTTIQTAVSAAVATAVGSNSQQQNQSAQANCVVTGGSPVSPTGPTTSTCR